MGRIHRLVLWMTNAENIAGQRVWPLQTITHLVRCCHLSLMPSSQHRIADFPLDTDESHRTNPPSSPCVFVYALQKAQFLSLHLVQYHRTTNFEHTVTFDSIPSTSLSVKPHCTSCPAIRVPHLSIPSLPLRHPPPHSRSQLHSFPSFSVSALQYDWNAPVKLPPNYSEGARDPFSLSVPGRTRRCGPISEI